MPESFGQHEVEEDEVRSDLLERARAPRAVRGRPSPRTLAREPDDQGIDEGLLVFCDEYRCGGRLAIVALRLSGRVTCRVGRRHEFRLEVECRVSARRRHYELKVDPSPSRDSTSTSPLVVGGNVTDDRQPEPGPAGLAAPALVDPVEALEDAVEVACRNADPVVDDP